MRRFLPNIFIICFGFFPFVSLASHIVGGELSYKYLGNNIYQFKLKVYRDCNSGVTGQYDNPTTLTVFNSSGTVVTTVPINFPGSNQIPNNTGNICLTTPPNVCVEEAIFQANVVLPPITGGYIICWQRCCRNATAVNISNSGTTGATYVATIPDPAIATGNSSPVFTNFPPTCICVDQPLVFDHAATDIDGDQLVYSFYQPFAGASTGNATPVPANPPPFPLVNYLGGFTANNPVTSSPGLTINSSTGLITGTPNALGQYIVGVCVKEYRNGNLVSIHYRDFQFNVVQCLQNVTASLPAFQTGCKNTPITFVNNSANGTYYHWDFGVTGNADTSNLFSPTFTYSTPGTYTITLTVNPGFSCAATATSTITIYNNPTATPTSNSPICEGDALDLFAASVASGSYAWTGPDGFSSSSQNPVITNAQAVNAGVYHLAVTANGCTSLNAGNLNVVVNPIPAAPTISSNAPICVGAALHLTAVSVSGATYHWTGPNGWTSNNQNPNINATTAANAGSYSCSITVLGCTSPASSITVVLNPIPTAPAPSSNAPFCSGGTLNLSSATLAGATYHWSGPNGFSSSLQNPVISPITTAGSGTYSLSVTVNGCNSTPVTTSVVIYPIPNSIATSNSPACIGQSINLSSTTYANATYSWTGPNGWTSSAQNPVITNVTAANAGTYTVSAIANGCIGTPSSTIVVVNPIPAAPVLSNNAPMCSGQTLNLTAQNVVGGTFNWTGPNSFSSNQQNPVITNVPFANGGTYSATVTVLGCTSTAATTSAVINLSPVATPTNNGALCEGATLNLNTTAVAGASYSWSGPNGFTSTLQSPVIPNVTIAGNAGIYTLTMALAGCTGNSATTNVVIHAIPASPALSSNSPICAGQTLQLNASYTMNGVYNWTGPNAWTATTQNPTIANASTAASGTYSATVKLYNCTSPASSIVVLVNPVPVAPTISSNSPLCAGQTINFTAGGVAGGTYNWTGPAAFTSTLQNPSVTNSAVSNSGNYSATVSVNGCASVPSTVNVVVNPIPSSAFTLGTPACAGNAVGVNYNGASAASATYNWNFGSGTIATGSGQGPYSVSWSNAGNYNVSLAVTENGCTSPTTTNSITVYPVPTSTFNLPTSICSSDSALISYSGSATVNAAYSWDFGGGIVLSGNGAGPYQIKFASAGIYTITLSVSENGCTSSLSTQTITVNPVPTADFTVTPNVICPEQNTQILYTGTGTASATFNWSFGSGTVVSGSGSGPYTVHYVNPNTETITLTVTENNCPSSQVTQTLLIDSLPKVSFTVSDSLGCDPFTTQFTNTGFGGNSYLWNFGDEGASADENPVHTYAPGVFSVKLTTTNLTGCVDSLSKPNLIHVLHNPVANFNAKPEAELYVEVKDAQYQFMNQSTYADSYTWFFGDGDSSKISSPSHTYTIPGEYEVILVAYDSIGCTDTFRLGIFHVIHDINYFIPSAFTPNGDGINDIFKVYGASLKSAHLMVYDRSGEMVFESQNVGDSWDGTFHGQKLNLGVFVYYAEITTLKDEVVILKGDVTLMK